MATAVAEVEARNQELALVARTGPLLQQSLALGDLLPSEAQPPEETEPLDLFRTAGVPVAKRAAVAGAAVVVMAFVFARVRRWRRG